MARLLIVATVPVTLRAFLLPFARHFRAQGWKVDAMAQGVSSCAECVENFDQVWDMEWSRNLLDLRNLFWAPREVYAIVAHKRYDIIHVHTPIASFITRYALRNLRKRDKLKIIYTAHGFHFYKGASRIQNILALRLERLAGHWTDYLIVINREDEQAAKRYRIVPPDRVRYIPGVGIDTHRYSPDAVSEAEVARVRQELGLSPEDRLFLMVAEFNPGKRHEDALRAFSKLKYPKTYLALAGDGPLFPDMQKFAKQLGLQDRVHFLGFRRDVPALVRASVATLLPSEREGLPRSVMESLCLEIPVIGTDIRGIRDLIEKGCGLLVKVGDIDELAEAMKWVLEHPEEAQAMGRKGRERMAAYDIQHILKLHEVLYMEALERGKP